MFVENSGNLCEKTQSTKKSPQQFVQVQSTKALYPVTAYVTLIRETMLCGVTGCSHDLYLVEVKEMVLFNP